MQLMHVPGIATNASPALVAIPTEYPPTVTACNGRGEADAFGKHSGSQPGLRDGSRDR